MGREILATALGIILAAFLLLVLNKVLPGMFLSK